MEKSFFNKVFDTFLEGMAPDVLVAGFIYALIGVFISMLIDATTRDPLNSNSPVHWSWSFFFSDKLPRFFRAAALTILVIFISLKFMDNIIGKFSMFYSLLIGFALDDVKSKWLWIKSNFLKGKQ